MQDVRSGIRLMALIFVLLAAQAAAIAQAQTPTREGNIWGWRDHQPTEAEIQQSERAAGVEPTPAQKDSNAATVDQLYQQLLHPAAGE